MVTHQKRKSDGDIIFQTKQGREWEPMVGESGEVANDQEREQQWETWKWSKW
jgi:hypothetical protein